MLTLSYPYSYFGNAVAEIAVADLVCTDFICRPNSTLSGRSTFAKSTLTAMQNETNRVIRDLILPLKPIRTDGTIDEDSVRTISAVVAGTNSDVASPFGFLGATVLEAATKAPVVLRYLQGVQKPSPPPIVPPPIVPPPIVPLPSPPIAPRRRLSTGAKIAIGVGVLSIVGVIALVGRAAITR
jgi:hypothetical protein